jgi:flavin-dependent dehydrogenase
MDVGLALANYYSQTMKAPACYDVAIIGGGLAGLTSAIQLASANKSVLLIEKKTYPFHKVCGEYLSNEVRPFLEKLGLDFIDLGVANINKFRISDTKGRNAFAFLDMGGFGISRYKLDQALCELAIKKGAQVLTATRVKQVVLNDNFFEITIAEGLTIRSKLVLGAYGKRDMLDKQLKRKFVSRRTGFMAVKYHITIDRPVNEVGLDNFRGGYCGISKIEGDRYCLCYLSKRENMKGYSSIAEMEKGVLFKNPYLKAILSEATFLYDKPEVINEIYFNEKELVAEHVIMCGDAAGLITPLCGNGMSMAIHGAKIACELILGSGILEKEIIGIEDRTLLEKIYIKTWNKTFKSRLRTGRIIQRLFLLPLSAALALFFFKRSRLLKKWLIRKTHGDFI